MFLKKVVELMFAHFGLAAIDLHPQVLHQLHIGLEAVPDSRDGLNLVLLALAVMMLL